MLPLPSCTLPPPRTYLFFFFNDTATTEIYTLSLHDALPIFSLQTTVDKIADKWADAQTKPILPVRVNRGPVKDVVLRRSEEHTSELQSRSDLVCRLLLEKKKKSTDSAVQIQTHYTLHCCACI